VQLREYGGNNVAYLQARDDSSNRDIGLRIRTQKAGASAPTITEALTIDGNGNVGVGTPAPNRSLTIGNAAGANYMNIKDATHEVLLGVDGAGAILSVLTNHDLSFRTGSNSEKMRITASGNVGIGISTPRYPLSFGSNLSNTKLAIWDGGPNGNAFGLGVQGGQFRLHLNQATDRFSFLDSANGANELLTIRGDGNIISPMWRVTQVYSYVSGPLTRSGGTFTSGGGTLLIFASGSGFRGAAAGMIGMRIRIDGTERGVAQCFTNEVGSHKTFVTNCLVVGGIAAGSHAVSLEAMDTLTLSDGNDRFDLTVLELPFQTFTIIPIPIPIPPIVINP
jgi:hypothetical protein